MWFNHLDEKTAKLNKGVVVVVGMNWIISQTHLVRSLKFKRYAVTVVDGNVPYDRNECIYTGQRHPQHSEWRLALAGFGIVNDTVDVCGCVRHFYVRE